VISDNASGSSLTIDGSGNLYGAGGSAWELVRDSDWKVQLLHIFCSSHDCRDGWEALAPPTFDSAGNLYGTTKFGGNGDTQWCQTSGGCGVAYKLTPGTDGRWSDKVLHRFGAFKADGQLLDSGVVTDSNGNVYGTTLQGGIGGAVFELSPQADGSWKETIVWNFPNASHDGGGPIAGLVFDQAGNLYGTTSAGGDASCPAAWSSK
jgi:hypothetical protein